MLCATEHLVRANFDRSGVVDAAMGETSRGFLNTNRGKIPHKLGRSVGTLANAYDAVMNDAFN